MKVRTFALLSGAIATGAGSAFGPFESDSSTFQATGTTSTGDGDATIKIQVSNDNSNWIDLGTISLTLSTSAATDGFAALAPWAYVRANVTAISGTNAAVTVTMSI